MTTQRGFLFAIVLVSLIWSGIGIGVAFIATPAKFLSAMASLPVLIDIGRQTFALLEKVDCFFAAVLLALALAAPALKRRVRVVLLLPMLPFLVDFLWLRPILDIDAEKVVAGLTPSDNTLHLAYACLVALQICLSIVSAALALAVLVKSAGPAAASFEAMSRDSRPRGGVGLTL